MAQLQIGPAETQRLIQIITEGVDCMNEIKTLKDGLADTVKSVAEELELPPTLIKKAINISFKGNFDAHQEELAELDEILTKTGKK